VRRNRRSRGSHGCRSARRRILFAAISIVSGSTVHLLKWREGISYARASNVPAPELLVPASGVIALGGGLLVAFGPWADLGALLLAAFVFPVAVGMHAFWSWRTRCSARISRCIS
jgi:putative oxidoreductase